MEIYDVYKYLPIKSADPIFSKYITHHSECLFKCFESKLYSSAFSHLHILYMVFVYTQLLRISQEKKIEFDFCWIGFPSQEKDFLKNPSSPFSFSQINEKTVFRFFRLVGFDDSEIGEVSCLVNKRNDHLHANGKIFFEDEGEFEEQVMIYLQKMQKIITKQIVFLEDIYTTITKGYTSDYQFTRDDFENAFGAPYFFSEYELKLLSDQKTDIVSQYILENL